MSELPHVIWDMGGILYPYFTERMLDIGFERGWPIDRVPLGPTGPIFDADYQRMLEGDLNEPEYLAVVKDRLLREGIEFDPPADLAGGWEFRPESWETIDTINRLGHRQALLTNDATTWLGEAWWGRWDRADSFDAIVDVVEVGARKPAPEPYLAAATALGAPPGECLFVDDLPVNCRGAEAVGMSSHLFDITDPYGSSVLLIAALQRA